MTKDVISLSISVLLLFRHYISHKITFGAPSSGGVLCSACGAFIYPLGQFGLVYRASHLSIRHQVWFSGQKQFIWFMGQVIYPFGHWFGHLYIRAIGSGL